MDKKESFIKIWVPILICVLAFVVGVLPIFDHVAFRMLFRIVALLVCLLTVCGGHLDAKKALICCAVMLGGLSLFTLAISFLMYNGAMFPEIFELVAYFAAFFVLYCKVCRKTPRDIGAVTIAVVIVLINVQSFLTIVPDIIMTLSSLSTPLDYAEFLALSDKFSIVRSIIFYVTLSIAAARCGAVNRELP